MPLVPLDGPGDLARARTTPYEATTGDVMAPRRSSEFIITSQLLYHESADIVIRSDLNLISRPANESSDQGLSNQRGIAKIHQVTAVHEPLEVEVEIPWIPSRTRGSDPRRKPVLKSVIMMS